MKFIIGIDLEGVACAVGRPGEAMGTDHHYQWACTQAAREANAAAGALLDAGAEQVILWDNHSSGVNLAYEQLDPRCDILLGSGMARRWGGLIRGFDGALMIGYHAMDGTPDAVLAHSYSSRAFQSLSLDGRMVGEIAVDAAEAGSMGVPVIFVSSDEAGALEARRFLPWAETVATKRGLGWNAALSLSPESACRQIAQGVRRAVARLDEMRPFLLGPPLEARVRFKRLEEAQAALSRGWERVEGDPYAVRKSVNSPEEVARA